MDLLYVEPSKVSPEIFFNSETNILKIKGQSYPENAFKFYEPVFNWVDQYLRQSQEGLTIEIEFKLPYINTSSSKCIMMLLEKFEDAFLNGRNIVVNWYYDQENESEYECAEEFKEDLKLPFNMIVLD